MAQVRESLIHLSIEWGLFKCLTKNFLLLWGKLFSGFLETLGLYFPTELALDERNFALARQLRERLS
jgi:hypothetical protein